MKVQGHVKTILFMTLYITTRGISPPSYQDSTSHKSLLMHCLVAVLFRFLETSFFFSRHGNHIPKPSPVPPLHSDSHHSSEMLDMPKHPAFLWCGPSLARTCYHSWISLNHPHKWIGEVALSRIRGQVKTWEAWWAQLPYSQLPQKSVLWTL